MSAGTLYIVATPIGNLDDMSVRAREILAQVDAIAVEDTRHSAKLLQHFRIATPTFAVHDFNEREICADVIAQLQAGRKLALISDAGTPLISDPGFRLVRAARAAGLEVVPIPGACAAIAALSVAGLPSDRFVFEGFPPQKSGARQAYFAENVREPRTLIYYESPHRIEECIGDMAAVFGNARPAVLARELTKKFETVYSDTLEGIGIWLAQDENQRRGEFVVLVAGAPALSETDRESERVLRLLLAELPVKKAAALTAEITGAKKNALYQLALTLGKDAPGK